MNQRQQLAADAAALFSYEMQGSLRVGSAKVVALVTDVASTATDAFGGADPIDIQQVVLLAAEAAALDLSEGTVAYTSVDGTATKEKKKIIVSSVLSLDEVTVNVTLRAA